MFGEIISAENVEKIESLLGLNEMNKEDLKLILTYEPTLIRYVDMSVFKNDISFVIKMATVNRGNFRGIYFINFFNYDVLLSIIEQAGLDITISDLIVKISLQDYIFKNKDDINFKELEDVLTFRLKRTSNSRLETYYENALMMAKLYQNKLSKIDIDNFLKSGYLIKDWDYMRDNYGLSSLVDRIIQVHSEDLTLDKYLNKIDDHMYKSSFKLIMASCPYPIDELITILKNERGEQK